MPMSQDPPASHVNPFANYVDRCIAEAWRNHFQGKPNSPELQCQLDALGEATREPEPDDPD